MPATPPDYGLRKSIEHMRLITTDKTAGDSLRRAEMDLELYLNLSREPRVVNRIRKFFRHPLKYLTLQFARLIGTRRVVKAARTCFGTKMVVPLWDQNAAILYLTGTLAAEELRITRFLLGALSSDDVFYDVGANLGYFSSLAEALGAQVHSFDPNPSILDFLKENVSTKTCVNEVALSDRAGTSHFFDMSDSGKSGTSSLVAPARPARKIDVPTISLDEYGKNHAPPTVMKVDVEGAEAEVLRGGLETLREYHPVIVMETLPGDREGRTEAARAILRELGYIAYAINRDGSLNPSPTSGALNLVFKWRE